MAARGLRTLGLARATISAGMLWLPSNPKAYGDLTNARCCSRFGKSAGRGEKFDLFGRGGNHRSAEAGTVSSAFAVRRLPFLLLQLVYVMLVLRCSRCLFFCSKPHLFLRHPPPPAHFLSRRRPARL
jgi:hypothetical protein